MHIRSALSTDSDAIWSILEPTIRSAETYALPADLGREDALAFWMAAGHEVFVAEEDSTLLGTYFLKANQRGGGSHVANCGYVTSPRSTGRGVGRAMCAHSLDRARERGFTAMQFNFVVATNEQAIRLWKRFDFNTVGRIPGAYRHPAAGFVDALVMHRRL
jgi:ribosomal protein S18 acetylase RimI-like enzyme